MEENKNNSPNEEIPYKNAKERLYDKIPLNKKQMDIIIIVLCVLLVTAFVIGTLRGNGII